MGWSTYFAFILAAINTLTVTYFLAIDNYPSLKLFFPSFEMYILIIVTVGVPILIAIGYAHFKRTKAFKSEIDVMIESNPYQRRNTVNNEMNLRMNLQLIKLLTKLVNDDKLESVDSDNLKKLIKTYEEFTKDRTFTNNSDIDFIKKEIQDK
jgi:hypothetical protein|tara:strand:+ start:5888 stop:6343 length:456 start_codon:yes stop_codon:yes gene_type:complete